MSAEQKPSAHAVTAVDATSQSNNAKPIQRVQFDTPEQDEKSDSPKASQMLSARGRRNTAVEHVEARYVPHKYVIRRPRALQVEYHGKVIDVGDSGKLDLENLDTLDNDDDKDAGGLEPSRTTTATSETSNTGSTTSSDEEGQERSTDNVHKQRERLDLFIDLVWVGIISNLSENYFAQSFAPNVSHSEAVVVFIILFTPSWQLWSKLQLFLSNYYMDDLPQRAIILWILVLAVIWGNVAPFGVTTDTLGKHSGNGTRLICLYLVASGSLLLTEILYSIWIPWTRRAFLWSFIFTLPATGLWIAAISTTGPMRVGFMWGGVAYERIWSMVLNSPLSDRLLGDGLKRTFDRKHIRKRYENFFIIALGEGVFLLIRGSPLGMGFNIRFGRGIMSLMIFYCLHTIYFFGDSSKTSVHPVFRRWWIRALWQFVHLPLFAMLVLLSSGILYLVDYTPEGDTNGVTARSATGFSVARRAEGSAQTVSTSYNTLETATATCFISLAFVILATLILGLLAKPQDPPKTLVVNNRYVRLAPRAAAVVALSTMWLAYFDDPTVSLGLMNTIIWTVMMWEWHASMERGGGFLEPKDAKISD